MAVRLWYEINTDTQYLSIYHEIDFSRERHFVAGTEGVVVPARENPPDSVKHAITSVDCQQLLDALLMQGFRPSNDAWSAGHVSDLKKHIEFAERVSMNLLEKK